MTFIRQNWVHLVLDAAVIYILYILMAQESSNVLVFAAAYIPVSLLFLSFAFGCHRGIKWQYMFMVATLLLPAAVYTYLTHLTAGPEIVIYLIIILLGQLMGFGMRSVINFFRNV